MKKLLTEDWWRLRFCQLVRPNLLAMRYSFSLNDLIDCKPNRTFVDEPKAHGEVSERRIEAIQNELRRLLKCSKSRCRISTTQRNMRTLGSLLGLSDKASDWLAFAAYLQNYGSVLLERQGITWPSFLQNNWLDSTGGGRTTIRDKFLEDWSGLSVVDLALLEQRGILTKFEHQTKTYSDDSIHTCVKFQQPYRHLATVLHFRPYSVQQILRLFITELVPSKLAAQDFQHIQSDIVVDYLGHSVCSTKGANVLVYGPPGTGKTEFVRWLAVRTGLKFFVATPETMDAGAVLERAMMSAEFLEHYTEGVLVVDEAEDVFTNTNYSGWLTPGKDRFGKGKLNAFLENNGVPIIWICNQRNIIDPAVRRRFDLVIEIDRLPREARLRSIRKHTHGLSISTRWKEAASRNEDLTVADINSACRAVKRAGGRVGPAAEAALEQILQAKLKEREQSTIVLPKEKVVVNYSLDFVNTDVDLAAMERSFQQGRTGRFCFYGPAGTGKTEFVRHTAAQLDKRLIERPASALLGMYVGQTEKNISRAFTEAQENDAILLIDEADSFLRSREGARQTWEVSQVNELLVQMERFDGTLICCSNLVDSIDPAAFRRFDMKIKFDFMQPKQVLAMLEQVVGSVPPELLRRVDKLHSCTPGDFAAVLRRFTFLQQPPDCCTVLDQLEQEVSFKPEASRRQIGF